MSNSNSSPKLARKLTSAEKVYVLEDVNFASEVDFLLFRGKYFFDFLCGFIDLIERKQTFLFKAVNPPRRQLAIAMADNFASEVNFLLFLGKPFSDFLCGFIDLIERKQTFLFRAVNPPRRQLAIALVDKVGRNVVRSTDFMTVSGMDDNGVHDV
jgi:hypothetical protein